MLSRAMYPKRRGRRPVAALAALTIITGLMVASGTALAVHDEDFQLDGDVIASTQTTAGGETQPIDWDSIFNANGTVKNTLPTDFEDAAFVKDFTNTGTTFVTSDSSTFATGSKDTLPISGWQCNRDNNVNSKIDVMNAYTVAYEAASGDDYLYFALERPVNVGTANVGFWFFQAAVGCSSPGGSTNFTGQHTDGDVLVVSEFSNGGAVSTIQVYRWDGGANGSLNPTPIGTGVDCRSNTTPPDDNACAVANTAANGVGGTITTPWTTFNSKDGVGNKLRTSEFFEGGINLTDLGLGDKCFNSFLGDTRSSTSLTATLFDYAGGTVGTCGSETVTTPSISSATIPGDPNDASLSVTDSAAVTVDGVDTWSGTVSFNLCGPMALDSTTLCDTGGVAVGTAKNVSNATPTVSSDAAIVTSAGRYCWRAVFSGDAAAGVPSSSDSRANECFVVNPRQSTLSTQAGAGPVAFGQPVTDSATLGNTAHQPGTGGPAGSNGTINPTTLGGDADGTITFTLYKADCTTLATGTGTNPQTVTVSGNATYGPVSFTPDAPGTYHWKASYDGDLPNTLGSTHNSDCSDSAETVVVQQISTQISTTPSAYPQDSATITSSVAGGSLPTGGTVTFRLYDNATCTDGDDVVGATGLLYKEALTGLGGGTSIQVSTSNDDVLISTDKIVYWKVTYATGNQAFTGRQSNCAENIDFDFTGDAGPGTLFTP